MLPHRNSKANLSNLDKNPLPYPLEEKDGLIFIASIEFFIFVEYSPGPGKEYFSDSVFSVNLSVRQEKP